MAKKAAPKHGETPALTTKAYEKDENGQYPEARIEDIRVTRKVKRVEAGA